MILMIGTEDYLFSLFFKKLLTWTGVSSQKDKMAVSSSFKKLIEETILMQCVQQKNLIQLMKLAKSE